MVIEKKYYTLDEIVFEHGNKTYGAYYLRQIHERRRLVALFIGTGVIVIFAGVLWLNTYLNKNKNINVDKTVAVELANMKPPEELPPPPPPPPPEALEQKVKFVAPVVTTDTTQETATLNQEILNQTITNTAVDTVEEVVENKVIEDALPPPLTFVEEMPTPDGGEEALYKYLQNNIKYPPEARDADLEGKVWVTFVVEKDGNITDVKLMRDIGGGCGAEAVRVVKAMPKWKPGRQNGVAVRVQYNLPVTFTLQG